MKNLARFIKISAAVMSIFTLALLCTSSSVADTFSKSGTTAKVDNVLDENNAYDISNWHGRTVTSVKEFTPAKTVNVANGNFLNGDDFTLDGNEELASPYYCWQCGAWLDIIGPNHIEYTFDKSYHNDYHNAIGYSFVNFSDGGESHSTQIHYKEKLYEVTVNYYKP